MVNPVYHEISDIIERLNNARRIAKNTNEVCESLYCKNIDRHSDKYVDLRNILYTMYTHSSSLYNTLEGCYQVLNNSALSVIDLNTTHGQDTIYDKNKFNRFLIEYNNSIHACKLLLANFIEFVKVHEKTLTEYELTRLRAFYLFGYLSTIEALLNMGISLEYPAEYANNLTV